MKLVGAADENQIIEVTITIAGRCAVSPPGLSDPQSASLTLRQRRIEDPNPKVIIYTQTSFAVLRNFEFLPMILKLTKSVQKKLAGIFENLNQLRVPI